jgi:hypothetical protein
VNYVRAFPLTKQANDCIDELTGDPVNVYQSPKTQFATFCVIGYNTFEAFKFSIFLDKAFPLYYYLINKVTINTV